MSGNNIPKGFVLKARKIEDSAIAHGPPCVREVWDWLLRSVNYRARKCGKTTIRRGQILTSVPKIREALHWTVGVRKERYETHQIERAMKILRRWGMVAVTKAGGGMFVTVLNYDTYQNPDNYESRNESRNESRMKAGPKEKKERRKKEPPYPLPEKPPQSGAAQPPDPGLVLDCWNSHQGRSVEKNGERITWKSHKRKPDGSLPPDIEVAIRRCLDAGYSIEEMCAGINNYATVLLGPQYWWSHVWPLATFLTVADGRGKNAIPKWTKFHPDNFVPETYIAKRHNSNPDESEQDIGKLAGCEPADEDDAARVYQEAGLIEE